VASESGPRARRSRSPALARLAAVVPALDEAAGIAHCVRPLLAEADEVIVVDGGSADATAALAREAGARVVVAERGRASQMNAGARETRADVLVFVHADTRMPPGWRAAVDAALAGPSRWGRFDVRLDSDRPLLALVGAMMNLRSRATGIATGDQAIFVAHDAWRACGGFPPIRLMEDVEVSRRLKRAAGPPACLRLRVRVSARRWETRGVLRTIVQMWLLRAMYFFGASPAMLHRLYDGRRR
jgi:rSAM/selenodomain-associated transferase 2